MIRMDNPPIFTPKERDENEAKKEKLTELILSGEAVLVAGAGISVDLGYPNWRQLLDDLEQLAESCGENFQRDEEEKNTDPLRYTDKIKAHIEHSKCNLDRYKQRICNLFSPDTAKPPNEFHKNLVDLPFKGILTTNYDEVLERALAVAKPPYYGYFGSPLTVNKGMPMHVADFFYSLNSNNNRSKKILHLHGLYNAPESIILSNQDYIDFYKLERGVKDDKFKDTSPSWSLHRKVLWAMLATRRSVWLGFSMKDPYLKEMLRIACDDLWNWDKSVHFALMGIDRGDNWKANKQFFRDSYGMEVVFYESTDTDHSGLKQYIESVYERYKEKQVQSDKSKSGKEHEPQMKNIIPSMSQTVGKKKSSDWLDRINQTMEDRIKVDGR